MFSLRLERLKHGWVDLYMDGPGGASMHTISSVPRDSIRDLLESAISGLNGIDHQFILSTEPTFIPYKTSVREGHLLILTGTETFQCTPARYARQILSAVERLRRSNEDGYNANWGHPYPGNMVLTLKAMLDQAKKTMNRSS